MVNYSTGPVRVVLIVNNPTGVLKKWLPEMPLFSQGQCSLIFYFFAVCPEEKMHAHPRSRQSATSHPLMLRSNLWRPEAVAWFLLFLLRLGGACLAKYAVPSYPLYSPFYLVQIVPENILYVENFHFSFHCIWYIGT